LPDLTLKKPTHNSLSESWCFSSQARKAAGVLKKVGVTDTG